MIRSVALKSATIAAAGIAALFFSPVLAQAATASPAISASATPASPGAIDPIITYFTGLTYPDTSTGLTDCDLEGETLVYISDGEDLGYQCKLGDPDSGVYNLWITYWNPNYCRTC
jgi:hypothetical protein